MIHVIKYLTDPIMYGIDKKFNKPYIVINWESKEQKNNYSEGHINFYSEDVSSFTRVVHEKSSFSRKNILNYSIIKKLASGENVVIKEDGENVEKTIRLCKPNQNSS